MSDKDTSCYINTYRMGIHTALTHCIATHFFLFSLPFSQRNTESCQGFERKKPHSEAAQDFFRSELAKPLTASECGVTFADRKRKNHSSDSAFSFSVILANSSSLIEIIV